jgi:hypothetical protein
MLLNVYCVSLSRCISRNLEIKLFNAVYLYLAGFWSNFYYWNCPEFDFLTFLSISYYKIETDIMQNAAD